jgi:hypothetical protein
MTTVVAASNVMRGERFQAKPENAGHLLDLQPQKILHLRARDQDRNSVREADHDWPRNKLDRRAHASDTHRHQQYTRHHRAHEQAIYAMHSDNPGDDHDECSGRSTNLRFRSSQQGNQESRHDCAVDARLRGQARGDRKRHRKWQRDEADGEAGD